MTLETEVAALTSATTALLDAVNVRKTVLDQTVTDATAQADAASASAGNAAASAGAASTSQTAAATAQAQTLAYKDAAAASAASAASAVLGQTTSKLVLDVVDQTVFASTTLVDAVIYDTGKDSDGGAWRKRCQHTSWYNETIYGKWLGSASSEANARAISGATTADYYYDTTAAKFYALNAGSGRTEVFRGNTREFPARALITAEAARVVIWDLTAPGCPMWGVLPSGSAANYLRGITGVAASHGRVVVGQNDTGGSNYDGLREYDFNNDRWYWAWLGSNWYYKTNLLFSEPTTSISGRPFWLGSAWALVNYAINDVALTVLPDAPIDPVTGLAIPTIYVFTDGGVSRIAHNGTVSSTATATVVNKGWITERDVRALCQGGTVSTAWPTNEILPVGGGSHLNAYWRKGLLYNTAIPATLNNAGGMSAAVRNAFGGTLGLTHLKEDPSTTQSDGSHLKSMVAYSTIAYATGFLPGDIRLAAITEADGVSETLVGAELVTNGTFDVDANWSKGTGWSIVDGVARHTADGTTGAYNLTQSLSLVAGKTYRFQATVSNYAWNGSGSQWVGIDGTGLTRTGTYFVSGNGTINCEINVATATSIAVYAYGGVTCDVDNISVREVIPDRSVKNNGLVINGSLTKAPVAAGAGLCALSGFSATNYLEQAYSSNLDFGTGDFCIGMWVNLAATGAARLFERGAYSGSAYSGSGIRIARSSTNNIQAIILNSGLSVFNAVTSVATVAAAGWHQIWFVRRGNNLEMWLNGVKDAVAAITTATASLSNAAASVILGRYYDDVAGASTVTLALFRTAALAPSEDQLKHIYETEKKLFEPGAQCAIAGNSNAVTALTYDEDTDLLHVGTSWGRSAFQGLLRVSSEATQVGAIKALAASGGTVVQAGATAADIYIPAYSLREELERLDDATRALGSVPVFHEFDAIAAQTAFDVPKGFRVVAVYSAGALKRQGATKDYTIGNDGFKQTVNFAVAPGAGAWVSLMTVRSN